MSGPSRNGPCACGSGVKYKKCCGKDQQPRRPAPVTTPPTAGGSPLDVGRWLALKALWRPGERVHPLDDPRIAGAMLGLWAPPRRPDRPPTEADYARLVSALLEIAEDPDEVRLEGGLVVFDVEFDEHVNTAIKRLPGRRFDWQRRVWTVPAKPAVAAAVGELLDALPWLTVSAAAREWLDANTVWTASVGILARAGRPVFVVIGDPGGAAPAALIDRAEPWHPGWWSLPLDASSAELLTAMEGAVLDARAGEAVAALEVGVAAPAARLGLGCDDDGEPRFELTVGWAAERREAFLALPEARRLPGREPGVLFAVQAERLAVPADAALVDALEAFLSGPPATEVTADAAAALDGLRTERRRAEAAVGLSRAHAADVVLPPLGGTLEPFQRAGVAYALEQRRTFLADEQGLGKTVEALAALEADGAFPAVVVCPASLKLNWEREAARWLPGRSTAVVHGRAADPDAERADLVIVNYDVLEAHVERLAARRPRAAVFDESHYCKEPRAKRTQAALRLAAAVDSAGLRLALTGTPILNRPKELTSQLRLLDRLADFGSGARLGRRFLGADALERLHWHLRAHCYVRRTKAEVLPQLPAKRVVTLPVELANETEYRLAERDVIAWLQTLPLDLRTLEARVAAALRNERLVRLNHLRQLAARGKLRSALAWIDDWVATGEPLVIFAEHLAVQHAVLERHSDAVHVLGADDAQARDAAVRAFQQPDGPPLIVCSLRAASQGLTLTRASNVAFLELDWTPARLDQAEDRCHRIGQAGAVTAWYLLAPETIDETMAGLLDRKRHVIGAVTDGRRPVGDGLVEAVVSELRRKGGRQDLAVAA